MLACCFPFHRRAAEETKVEHLLKHPENNCKTPTNTRTFHGIRHPVPQCTTALQLHSLTLFFPQMIKLSFTTELLETRELADS